MDIDRKRLKRNKPNGAGGSTSNGSDATLPKQTETDTATVTNSEYPDICGSPEFLSSQECFSVGWDWSAQIQGIKKPTVRLVDRPRRKKNEGTELLECHKPRRLVRKDSPKADASFILEELKLLSSDLKRVPESSSPVASPTQSILRRYVDLPVTPTSSKSKEKLQEPVKSATLISLPSVSSKTNESTKENLSALLDESLGTDILKFTQDLESDIKQEEEKTHKLSEIQESRPLSSSKRKSRLSLSHSKPNDQPSRAVCRRIVSEVSISKPNNTESEPNIEFDEFDEATLLSINEIEEKEMKKSAEVRRRLEKECSSGCKGSSGSSNLNDDDDDLLASPDILDLIEIWEKEATQDTTKVSTKQKGYQPAEKPIQSRKKTLSLAGGASKCTPQEIEKKRQEAMKKRLQTKKN